MQEIRIDTKVGTFYVEEADDDNYAYNVLDSNKYFIGKVYTEDLEAFIESLKSISHISDICNLGVCDWMIFANSKEDLLHELNNYIEEENRNYDEHNELFSIDELNYGKFDFYNIVGNNHIIVDLD